MLSDYYRYRFYEILPGLSIWIFLILSILLSIFLPLWMIYFVIIFDIYWVLKITNFSFYLIVAWLRFKKNENVDWKNKMNKDLTNWQDKINIVFLTLYDEDWVIVKSALDSICQAVYDKEKIIIVVAGEERKKEHYFEILKNTKETYNNCFKDIVGTMHPMGLLDEIPGKGSNVHYAEKEIKKYIDQKGWEYKNVIATIFDIDTICHPQYFAYLTYLYCTHPNPTRCSYQPVAVYNNNMWESPSVLRIMAFGTTFWILTSLAKQDSLVTFSSQSMSFQAIVDVGFHDKRIVSEDSRIFYQCYLTYNGDYSVVPMYIPVSMDTVRDNSWWQSIKNLYKQQRRWAWGVEHVPYLMWEFRKKGKLIPWTKKIKWLFVEWEGKWSWCLVALLITVLGRLPMWLAPESIRQSALFFNAPHMLEAIMTISMVGLLLSATLSFPLLPKRPNTHSKHVYLVMVLQWLLLPFSMIFVSSIPAIDAVTRLMFGKYLGFNVSIKKRVDVKKTENIN